MTNKVKDIHLPFQIQCRHDSDCTSDECCYYHEGPIVLSKKRQALLPFSGIFQGKFECLLLTQSSNFEIESLSVSEKNKSSRYVRWHNAIQLREWRKLKAYHKADSVI